MSLRVRPAVFAAALALIAPGCRSLGSFTNTRPAAVPDFSRWSKSSGWADLEDPSRRVDYELYVDPERSAIYGVTRYRFSLLDGDGRGAEQPHEQLQWLPIGQNARRFECVLAEAGGPCRWRELAHGSREYDLETGRVISVYRLHSRLLRERDARAR